ncbi:MAG: hypothetical protein R3E99_14205 [Burkholderiaceae bacterium]
MALLQGALPDLTCHDGRMRAASLPSLEQVICVGHAGAVPSGYLDFNTLLDPARAVDHARLQALWSTPASPPTSSSCARPRAPPRCPRAPCGITARRWPPPTSAPATCA